MEYISEVISNTIKNLYGVDFSPTISPAPKPELGEYCINVFPLAKSAGKSPNILAEEIANKLKKEEEIFVSTSATGGYVNFFLTDSIWIKIFEDTSEKKNQENKTIVVDYIGANAGKPMHIGHICTPSIGQVICNTYRHLGYTVIGDSHYGDWGGIFGKLIAAGKRETRGNMDILMKNTETIGVNYLLDLYQKATKWIDEEKTDGKSDFDQTTRAEFQKLSHGDTENIELWKTFTSISLTETEKKLDLLNVRATYNIGESFYEGLGLPRPLDENYPDLEYTMKDIVKELIEKGVATANEDGSVGVIFPEESKLPSCILQKKDGTGLYLTSDLAAIKYRLTNGWNPEKIIYSVDVRQQLHLKQAFWIAKSAWPKLTENVEFFHAFNGFIRLKEGAMSTRHGTAIFLDALIKEGEERTQNILIEKGRTGENSLSQEDIRAITVAAIKYSYLAQDREKDVTFDWDKALSFEGHSGPYIQYAYVRAKKISEAGGSSDPQKSQRVDGGISASDKLLIQTLAGFDEAVMNTAKTYKPHHIALYAYELAGNFNSFYVHTPKILDEENESIRAFRLTMIQKTKQTLEKSFELLGIHMPSEM
ncbi:arginine--tRNA ligase [Candidatus Gracilibacteria bacterium]|nr:arginine--tRNA ligase [Candidatus Gracilibacteria bacterium]